MAGGETQITLQELEQALRRTDPAALLITPRLLRRVIKRDRCLGGLGLRVPHGRTYWIDRDALLAIADAEELGVPADLELPAQLLLLARPDASQLSHAPAEVILLRVWRMLFHARVHQALQERVREGVLTGARVREQVRRIGLAEYDEARKVLGQENRLLAAENPLAVYQELIALYLELSCFAPHMLKRYFPSLAGRADVEALLGEEIDAGRLFAQTRLPGAPSPAHAAPEEEDDESPEPEAPPEPERPHPVRHRLYLSEAEEAQARGNLVRAALRWMQAARVASGSGEAATALMAAQQAVEGLARRLCEALHLSAEEADAWREQMLVLLEPASHHVWSREGRMLYDLQKVCVDHERGIYSVDLVEWVVSWGRRPVKQQLPHQGEVLKVKHLRRALARLPSARIPAAAHLHLAELLHRAVHQVEQEVRRRFRPQVVQALDQVGLEPESFIDRVERDKLIEELLDTVVERGYLNMSQLRDAIARNRVKLPDMAGPGEFFLGDPLIRLNRKLALSLAGVYRRGEVYLRWLQRFSSLFFANRVGRFLTLYLFLPFGVAFMLLTFVEHMGDSVLRLRHTPPLSQEEQAAGVFGVVGTPGGVGPLLAASAVAAQEPPRLHLVHLYSVLGLGLYLLGLIHLAWLRAWSLDALKATGRGFRAVFWGWPIAFFRLPLVRRILQSRLYLFLYQHLVKPLVAAGLTALVLSMQGAPEGRVVVASGAVFVLASYLLFSRIGRQLEDATIDTMARAWALIRDDLVLGTFRLIMDAFKRLLDEVDRFIYTVDEWLRFRTGESRLALALKAVLGVVWWLVTYVVRFCVNLLIEPQINPIKHFPVVTVSHKLLLVILEPTASMVASVSGMGFKEALALTGLVFMGIPGIFGFLAWELKENWRLYRANESPTLGPRVVGGHGETVLRLLRPGIHSGTLPKLYARLRQSELPMGKKVRKQLEALHHVHTAVEHFVERDLLALLAGSKGWSARTPLELGRIVLGVSRIRIEIRCPALGAEGVWIELEQHGPWLEGGQTGVAWLGHLPEHQVRVWRDALAGFYKRSGVSLVREQIQTLLPPQVTHGVEDTRLVVWLDEHRQQRAYYDIGSRARRFEPSDPRLPVLSREELFYDERPVEWQSWVEVWRRDRKGQRHDLELVAGFRLLPLDLDRRAGPGPAREAASDVAGQIG